MANSPKLPKKIATLANRTKKVFIVTSTQSGLLHTTFTTVFQLELPYLLLFIFHPFMCSSNFKSFAAVGGGFEFQPTGSVHTSENVFQDL